MIHKTISVKHRINTLLCALLFLATGSHAQSNPSEVDNIALFCKVWGFLKYYHPIVSKGRYDWDKEFMKRVKEVGKLQKRETNIYYANWINELGVVQKCKKCNNEPFDTMPFKLNLAWLYDTSRLSNTVIKQLDFIRNNRNQKINYYYAKNKTTGSLKFTHEKVYMDSVYPTVELRLLGLSRYWNIINYLYPYKYLIGEDWGKVLCEMIPLFINAKDTTAYHLAMLELTAKTNDGHAFFTTQYTEKYFGQKRVPFKYKIIDGKAVVIGSFNDSLCRRDQIQYGDVFLKIDDLSVEEIIKQRSKYIAASNDEARLFYMWYELFSGNTDSVTVVFERNGEVKQKTIHRYLLADMRFSWNHSDTVLYKIIDENIGYINMGLLKPSQTMNYLNKLKNTKAIVFDLRNYPLGTLYKVARFLNSERKPFATFTTADIHHPGAFHFTKPYYCGKRNRKHYQGKVVLLFNEGTQSHAEFTVMALQTAPQVLSIGSQTAGADGDIMSIIFPGKYRTSISGIGVYYPDGKQTQRVGIKPDFEIKPTIEGIRLKRDELLDKALEILNRQ